MDKTKQYKIALVLYTSGLDFDDRIRKEILSIQKIYANIQFKIFAVEPQNREEEGLTSYGVKYRIPYLKTREKYKSASHTIQKAWEFYKSIKEELKTYDAIWCADPETFIFVMMIHGKPIAWDLHELPLKLMGNPIKRALFRYLESKCDVMVHANEARLEYLKLQGLVKHIDKQFVLRNYPQFNEIDEEYDDLYNNFMSWKGESKCAYLQGLNTAARAAEESVKAVLSYDKLKGVVVGNFDDRIKQKLIEEYGESVLLSRIFFTGKIKQLKTPQYIRQCDLSLVFYKHTSPNNWYCEPNRLFQSVINGVPVIVGNNPPLKEFVNNNQCGIVVETDGSETDKIIDGIGLILSNHDELVDSITKRPLPLWNIQDNVIDEIVKTWL